jgi:hypothetical protein
LDRRPDRGCAEREEYQYGADKCFHEIRPVQGRATRGAHRG